ncbi:hypothetical protein PYCC9005_002309 [Savitreella phatthalungensis]
MVAQHDPGLGLRRYQSETVTVNIANGSDFPIDSLASDRGSSRRHSYVPGTNGILTAASNGHGDDDRTPAAQSAEEIDVPADGVFELLRGCDSRCSNRSSNKNSFEVTTTAIAQGSIALGETQITDFPTPKAVRLADRMLLPPVYLMALLHGFAKNVSHAKTMGMAEHLDIGEAAYSALLMVYFLGFLAGTLHVVAFSRTTAKSILRRLNGSTAVTGILAALMVVTPYMTPTSATAYVTLFRLGTGFCEGAFAALMTSYLLQFYTSEQLARRMLLFFTVPGMSSALGALLCFLLFQIKEDGVLTRWQWLFLGQGCLGLIFAPLCHHCLPASPHAYNHLSEDHRSVDRELQHTKAQEAHGVDKDRSSPMSPQTQTRTQLGAIVRSPAAITWLVIDLALSLPATMVLLYLPQILQRAGFDAERSNLLTIFPYLLATSTIVVLMRFNPMLGQKRAMAGIFAGQVAGMAVYYATVIHPGGTEMNGVPVHTRRTLAYVCTFAMASGVGTTNVIAAKAYGSAIDTTQQRLLVNTIGVMLIQAGGMVSSWVFSPDTPVWIWSYLAYAALGFATVVAASICACRKRARDDLETDPSV